jgi:hypothetical protein
MPNDLVLQPLSIEAQRHSMVTDLVMDDANPTTKVPASTQLISPLMSAWALRTTRR